MTALPLLQLSLDFTCLAGALKIASTVDVIEIGTPVCKSVGLEVIRAVREVYPRADLGKFQDARRGRIGSADGF